MQIPLQIHVQIPVQIPMQIHVQIPVHCAACVNIYSCSWSVEGGLEKVSQRGEGEILFIEELFSAGEEGG